MMEDYGTKWSLPILYNNTLKFFIIGVMLISLLASKNAQPLKKKNIKKNPFRKLQSLSGGQTATLQPQIFPKIEHKSGDIFQN